MEIKNWKQYSMHVLNITSVVFPPRKVVWEFLLCCNNLRVKCWQWNPHLTGDLTPWPPCWQLSAQITRILGHDWIRTDLSSQKLVGVGVSIHSLIFYRQIRTWWVMWSVLRQPLSLFQDGYLLEPNLRWVTMKAQANISFVKILAAVLNIINNNRWVC